MFRRRGAHYCQAGDESVPEILQSLVTEFPDILLQAPRQRGQPTTSWMAALTNDSPFGITEFCWYIVNLINGERICLRLRSDIINDELSRRALVSGCGFYVYCPGP